MATSTSSISESPISVYAVDNNIYINTPKIATIEVYDLLGKLIMNHQSAQGLNKLQLNVSNGIYIVKVQNNGSMLTKKVVIN